MMRIWEFIGAWNNKTSFCLPVHDHRPVELGVVFYLNPQPRLDPRKNQNGTLAEDALLMEKFIVLCPKLAEILLLNFYCEFSLELVFLLQ